MNNRGPNANPVGGFTIIELMIVLAVSLFIFVIVANSISGKQAHVEFSQAVNQLQTELQQIVDNTQNDTYSNLGNFSCTGNRGATPSSPPTQSPLVVPGNTPQGQNSKCILLGKAVQFAVDDGRAQPRQSPDINIYPIIGNELSTTEAINGVTQPAQGIEDSLPILLPSQSNQSLSVTNDYLEYGLQFSTCATPVEYYSSLPAASTSPCQGGGTSIGAIGFASTDSNATIASQSGDSVSSQVISLVAFNGTDLGKDAGTGIGNNNGFGGGTGIDGALAGIATGGVAINPAGGVLMCLAMASVNQSALFSISNGNNQQLSVNVSIKNSLDCE